MSESEYIQLQSLLAKLRVHLLKEICHPDLIKKYRDIDVKLIRSVDYLRKNTPIEIQWEE